MTVNFLIGRSGSGKTTTIWETVSSRLKTEPLGAPIIILVPEQGSFGAERGLLAAGNVKGSIRAQTLSFSRLAYRVKQETGGSASLPISEEGKKMLIYKIVNRRKEELKLFGASSDRPGLVERLSDLHTELKRCCLGAGDLEEQLGRMRDALGGSPILAGKLEDLHLVFTELEQEMSQLYMDQEDRLAELAEHIQDSGYIRGAEIWVDGFHGFTNQEFIVLRELMQYASGVTIALTLDRIYPEGQAPHELELFHPAAVTYIKLRGMAEEMGLTVWDQLLAPPVLPRFKDSPALAHLERGFQRRLRWNGAAGQAEEAVSIRAAASRRTEVEGVLREMLSLARDSGAKYGEMAVFMRNMSDYEPLIAPLFQDFGVPFFLDQKLNELHHPLVEFIRSALDVVRRRWRYEDVFRCVKTELLLPLDGSITRANMDELENYVLACGIHGYRWTDGRSWKGIPRLSLEGSEAVDEAMLARMEACRSAITGPLQAFEQRVKASRSALELCRAVYLLLEDTEAARKLERMGAESLEQGRPEAAREHNQLWGAVLDLLDQIAEMMGKERMEFELFTGVLETGLAELKMGLVPPALDQVLVGTMDRTRVSGVKYAFLLGFNEGVVPAQFKEDGILSEGERLLLENAGMELAPGSSRKLLDERFLIYNALTTASRKLWISYATADDEGKALLPSEIIRQLQGMFPEGLDEKYLSGFPQGGEAAEDSMSAQTEAVHMNFIGHPEQTLRMLMLQLRQWRQGVEIPRLWWDVYNWFAADGHADKPVNTQAAADGQAEVSMKLQLERLLGSLFYRNEGIRLKRETSLRLYGGSTLRGSVSRMEKFVACSFSHFASYGLRLKERQLYKLQAPDIGQLFHAALSQMAQRLQKEGRSWGSMTAEECRREAGETVDRLSPLLQGEILMSSKRYSYISRKLKNIVGRASVILGEHSRRGSFEPVGLELDFGPGKDLPPLRITLPNGCVMEVVGRIDRVDMAEGEQGILLRVIDYKSSQKDLKLHEVYYGLSLQMLTYLDVLLTYSEQWLGQAALPAGALYFHVHDPLLTSANGMNREQAEQELMKRFKMKGLLTADREVVSLMDTTLDKGYSSIVPVALKSDGSFYSSASVATPEQWGQLLSSVRSTISDIGTRITEGDVAIQPYRIQQETACTFCSFRPVCQFDEAVEGNGYNNLSKPGKDVIWDLLSRKGGEKL
ncbi:helicase-exonuclease AddAB subunit AddB [Paenibacillus sp. LMG 31459]|uniref:ATP-dependent helicase/deoxyribonuclease subunit B n=1 Tax=Paenibacillus phytohabitans TaxID=2654978 RepID=A0ABX1YST7_9BACL|nr:helicase-exonuclease AddAB subunit AddB [Paenibacillus phytohabitans]NOU83958.1 helicase-exonuclease AddAB subunit AddB [Paenibacillus phytohabitans]